MPMFENDEAPETEHEEPTEDTEADAPEGDGDVGEQPDAAAAPARPSREQRRRERGGKHAELERRANESAELRRLVEQEREARHRQDVELAQLKARLEASAKPKGDDLDAQLEKLERQMEDELDVVQKTNGSLRKYHELVREKARLIGRHEAAQAIEEYKKSQANAPSANVAAEKAILVSEFPWADDQRHASKVQGATAYYHYLINVEGRQPGIATKREALAHVAAKHGLGGGRPRQTAEQRERYGHLPSGGSGRGAPSNGSNDLDALSPVDLERVLQGSGISPDRLRAKWNKLP